MDWKGVPETDIRLTVLSNDALMLIIDHDLREGVIPETPNNGRLDVSLLEFALTLQHFAYCSDAVIGDVGELGSEADFRSKPIVKCRNCICFQGGLSTDLHDKIKYEIEVEYGRIAINDPTACE